MNYPQAQTLHRDEVIRQECARRHIQIFEHGNVLRLVGREVDIVVGRLADVHLSDLEPFGVRKR